MSSDTHDQTPGEKMDQREKGILNSLLTDPSLWTVGELVRDAGHHGTEVTDAIFALESAGLVHRFVVSRIQGQEPEEVVIPTRAARRSDELYEESL